MRRLTSFLLALLLAGHAAASVVTHGPWSGAVTAQSAVVVARLAWPAADARLEISPAADFSASRLVPAAPLQPGAQPEIVRFTVDDLRPDTQYHYRVRAGTKADERAGTFRTTPAPGQPASFRFTFSSCGNTGSPHPVYTRIRDEAPLFHLTTGDLHYLDIEENSRDAFRAGYEAALASPTQGALYRAVAWVYTWDDHDFGPNGSDRHSPSREASHATYREYVPHHPLAWDAEHQDHTGPISQAFTVGRARFLVLDTRSQRDATKMADGPDKTMLGAWQKAWLQRELLAARGRFPLTFIVSSVSWISDDTKRDNWGAYATERAELSNWMVDQGITGVCFLSGDAHMLAADDGRHNAYARNGGPGFPALQAAPLDRNGSIKGGPWSVAPVLPEPGEGQYGLVEVTDRGDRIDVLFSGRNHEGREKLRLAFTVPALP